MGVDEVLSASDKPEPKDLVMKVADVDSDSDLDDEAASHLNPSKVEQRLEAYVASHLDRASGSKWDNYHDGIAYQMRKKIFKDFFSTKYETCGTCSA